MILLIDNYDSFSYNLYQLIGSVNSNIKVVRNDEMTLKEIEAIAPELIVLSPGPGKPENAGVCVDAVKYFAGKIPIFGVCLGHQAICEAFGATVSYAHELMHGKQSQIELDTDSRMFAGMQKKIYAARYHSLAVYEETLPKQLKVTARCRVLHGEGSEVMAVEHEKYRIFGVQFHPESVMTPDGISIIRNILGK
jgi:anthranilate synthase component II